MFPQRDARSSRAEQSGEWSTRPEALGSHPARPAPEWNLVLVLDCDQPRGAAARYPLGGVRTVQIGRASQRSSSLTPLGSEGACALGLADPWMSGRHAQLTSGVQGFTLRDLGSTNGCFVNGDRVTETLLREGDLLLLGHTWLVCCRLPPPTVPSWTREGGDDASIGELATLEPELASCLGVLPAIARSSAPVLLSGETGTGKEAAARAIHAFSGRPGELVAVNCGALAPHRIESELFGHRRSAVSGAGESSPGLLRASDRGTLFLDGVGEMPLTAQVALLRVLQEREVLAVGQGRPVPVDLRVVAATSRDLPELVRQGRFRADLLGRLSGYSLSLPPLRKRRLDLGLLVSDLLARLAPERPSLQLSTDAGLALLRHSWPLNLRELEQCLRGALALAGEGPVELCHLPEEVRASLAGGQRRGLREVPGPSGAGAGGALPDSVVSAASPLPKRRLLSAEEDEQRRLAIVALLERHRGNVSRVAQEMGKARIQIQRWLDRYRLDAASYRPAAAEAPEARLS